MSQEARRLEIAQKIVRVREQQLDQEVAALEDIRKRRADAVAEMQKAWTQYMAGVDRINKMRVTGQGAMLDAVEKGLDVVKQRWVDWLARVKQMDQAEKQQMVKVREKQGEVKMTEKLEDRSRKAVEAIERKKEQRILDDFAMRRFLDNRRAES